MDKLHQDASLTNTPPQSERDFAQVAEILKALREQRGETRQYIADHLRISEKYLAALESQDIEALPERVYALGFMRSYASYLGADIKECSSALKKALKKSEEPELRSYSVPDPATAIPRGWMVLGGVLMVILLYALWHFLDRTGDTQPAKEVLDSEVPLLESENTGSGADGMKGGAQPSPSVYESSPLSPASAVELPTQKPIGGGQREAASNVLPSSAPRPLEWDSKGGLQFSLSVASPITFVAQSLSWVEITTKDGRTLINRNFNAGMSETVPYEGILYLSTGNAGGLYLSINGQLHGPFGKEGEVLRHIPLHFPVNIP